MYCTTVWPVDMGEMVLSIGLGRMNSDLLVIGKCVLSGLAELGPNQPPLKRSV